MNFNVLNIHIPHTWVFCAALFFGAAVSQVTIIPARTRNPDAVRTRKWTLCWIFLSVALAFGLCAVFFPGAKNMIDSSLPKYFGITSGVFFFVFRFKKAVGLPMFLIVVIAVVTMMMTLKPWRENFGDLKIAEFTVLSHKDNAYRVEVRAAGESALVDVPGEELSVYAHTLRLHNYYVLGAGRDLYRFGGLAGLTDKVDNPADMPWRESSSSYLLEFLLKRGGRIPGVELKELRYPLFVPELLQSYSVTLSAEGMAAKNEATGLSEATALSEATGKETLPAGLDKFKLLVTPGLTAKTR